MVVKVAGVITPGAVMIPRAPGGKPVPVTVTTVPRTPLVGARVMVGTITVKGAVIVTAGAVTVKVAGPAGAPGSMVTGVAGIAPAPSVMKVTGVITPGAVMVPGA